MPNQLIYACDDLRMNVMHDTKR